MDIVKELIKINKNINLTREEVEKIQREKLFKLIKYAIERSEFYRDLYEKNGITLENYKDIPLEEYPTVNKRLMQEYFDKVVTDKRIKKREIEEFIEKKENWYKKYLNKYIVVNSSGSTGEPSIFLYDEKSWATVKSFIIGRGNPKKIREMIKGSDAVYIGATKGNFSGVTLTNDLKGKMYNTLLLDVINPAEKMLEDLKKFNPKIISGYASSVDKIALAQLEGKIDLHPSCIITGGDKLTLDKRMRIRKAFGIDPVDYYSASEALGIAIKPKNHDRFYIFDDYYKVEILDERMKEVKNGEKGKVVLTNLYNYTFPLIRYEMKDYVRKSVKQEGIFTNIDEVVGREEENLVFSNEENKKVELHMGLLITMYMKGLKKIQFIQKGDKNLEINYVGSQNLEGKIKGRLEEMLKELKLLKKISLTVKKVKDIQVEKNGKFKLVKKLN